MQSLTPAFDPSRPGTAEPLWRTVLDSVPAWRPATKRLIVVSPHPDDEVLGAGGLIHEWVRAGQSLTLVSVTDGEAAYPDWRGLGRVRRAELRQAMTRLCSAPPASVRLGIPDGQVGAHGATVRAALAALVDEDTTLIAPYESDGHPDHDATGAICGELAHSAGVGIARYPIWAWHQRSPATLPVRWGRFPLPPQASRAKAAAAACFTSQMNSRGRAPIVPAHVMTYFARPYECFVL